MNMIEKVEEAIRDNIAAALPDGVSVDYRYAAIATIEAMRTPSKAMLDAVEAEEEKRGYVAAAYESMDVETAWPIMIDAALAEDTACADSSKSQTGHRAD